MHVIFNKALLGFTNQDSWVVLAAVEACTMCSKEWT